jgi:Anthrone oxygenase
VHQVIDLLAVLVTVLLTGSELAIGVFVHPVLSKLQDAAHAEAAKPLARLLGRVMPFWYAAALLLVVVSLLARAVGTWSWWACLSSAALLAVTVPFSLICLVPINNRVAAWDLNALPADWKSDRKRWDQYHAIRIVILVLASVAIALAALFSQSGVA